MFCVSEQKVYFYFRTFAKKSKGTEGPTWRSKKNSLFKSWSFFSWPEYLCLKSLQDPMQAVLTQECKAYHYWLKTFLFVRLSILTVLPVTRGDHRNQSGNKRQFHVSTLWSCRISSKEERQRIRHFADQQVLLWNFEKECLVNLDGSCSLSIRHSLPL